MLIAPLRAALAALLLLAAVPAKAQDDTLKEAQNILLMLGADVGRPDGQLGQKTVKALSDFQGKSGLPVTGKLDGRTMDALRARRDSMGGTLGAPRESTPGGRASQRNQVESKPQAAPVAPVATEELAAPPGTRRADAAPEPARRSGGSSGGPASSPRSVIAPSPGGPPVEQPFRISDWLWILPMLGVPVFLFLLWGAFRKPIPPLGAPVETDPAAERREPGFGRAEPELAGGRREPTLRAGS